MQRLPARVPGRCATCVCVRHNTNIAHFTRANFVRAFGLPIALPPPSTGATGTVPCWTTRTFLHVHTHFTRVHTPQNMKRYGNEQFLCGNIHQNTAIRVVCVCVCVCVCARAPHAVQWQLPVTRPAPVGGRAAGRRARAPGLRAVRRAGGGHGAGCAQARVCAASCVAVWLRRRACVRVQTP